MHRKNQLGGESIVDSAEVLIIIVQKDDSTQIHLEVLEVGFFLLGF